MKYALPRPKLASVLRVVAVGFVVIAATAVRLVHAQEQAPSFEPDAALLKQVEAPAQVDLSATASALSEGDATFDAAKVERIALAIKDGKFTANHQTIADKLISNAQELLGRSGTSH